MSVRFPLLTAYLASYNYTAGLAAALVGCLLVSPLSCCPASAQSRVSGQQGDAGVLGQGSTFPVVLRFPEILFQSPSPEVNETSSIQDCVLGTPTSGTATVTAQIYPDFISSEDRAEFDLVYQGQSITRTRGRNGPATIHSVVVSQFELRTRITFSPSQGFRSSPADGQVRIVDTQRSVSPDKGGLRGRLIRTIARKRLREKQQLLRCIARKKILDRLSSNVDSRVSKRVESWNGYWYRLREAVRQQSWYDENLELKLATTPQHLLIFIRPGFESRQELMQTTLPPASERAKAEILLRNDWMPAEPALPDLRTLLTSLPELLTNEADLGPIRVKQRQVGMWDIFEIRGD